MLILSFLVYYLVPAVVALALVAWAWSQLASGGRWRDILAYGAAGLAAAPVIASDGYGAGILPLWLYGLWRATQPEMHGSPLWQMLLSWLLTCVGCWGILRVLASRRSGWETR